MSLRKWFFAATYDRQMAKVENAGLRAYREAVVSAAAGRVLEIGAGTGGNLSLYGAGVESLTLTEPDAAMLRRLEQHATVAAPLAKILRAPAEDLPFEDDSFDVAVSTLVLCGVSDQPRALRELRRVLRPEGQLFFLEHVRSTDSKLARRQDRMNGLNRFLVGCECNRPTLETIAAAGFDIIDVEHHTMPKVPSFVTPLIAGHATAPAVALTPDGR